jgi:hypothetical protein
MMLPGSVRCVPQEARQDHHRGHGEHRGRTGEKKFRIESSGEEEFRTRKTGVWAPTKNRPEGRPLQRKKKPREKPQPYTKGAAPKTNLQGGKN